MQTQTLRKTFIASAIISELQSSDIYLTVKARLLDLRANLNGVRVTSAFLDEIVDNKDKYVGIPLCADVRGLLANRTIGHMYDARTGEFHSTAIGAFYDFEREEAEETSYLIGYARIMKRNKAVCHAISDLFADNALKFSFEISCGAYTKDEDGTFIIDADEKNFLEGAAVVTFPACEDAVAMQLVAECLNGGEQEMQNENVTAEAEQALQTATETVTETENTTTTAESVNADTVYVHERHTEIDEQRAYNCDTGEEVAVEQITTVETHTPVEIAEDKPEEDPSHKDDAGDDDTQDKEPEKDEDKEENAACKEHKETAAAQGASDEEDDGAVEAEAATEEALAENEAKEDANDKDAFMAEIRTLFAERNATLDNLTKTVERMGAEIAELKKLINTPEVVVAEAQDTQDENKPETVQTAEDAMNPFMAEMDTPVKYSLLEKAEKQEKHYSLLERA